MTVFKRLAAAAAAALLCTGVRAALVINEVCYDNTKVADETGDDSSDWVELFNSGPGSVNIFNYGLGDANPYEEAKGVRLPNYTIPAGGYLVIFASSDRPEYTTWTNAADIAVIPENAAWRYLAPAPAGAPGATWKTNTYSDASWGLGAAPLGYNEPKQSLDCATVLGYGGNPADRYPTAYFRKTFQVVSPAVVTGLVVRARINDGMVVYLNGLEVLRHNMPGGAVGYSTLASTLLPSTLWTSTLLPTNGLVTGANLLAVEVHKASVSSPDLIMDLSLTALVSQQVPVVHAQFGLAAEGENVHLFNASLTRIHKYEYLGPAGGPGEDKSYGLLPDGALVGPVVYDKPTPGLSNATNGQKYQKTLTNKKPVFSVAPGAYPYSKSVQISAETESDIVVYTVDGSDPVDSPTAKSFYSGNSVTVSNLPAATTGLSRIRTNPVEISNSVPAAAWLPPVGSVARAMVLRAITVSADNKSCSPETTGTYFIGPSYTNRALPVVSLVAHTNDLFGFAGGLYLPGKHYADSPEGYGANKWGKPYANYHQDENDGESWERPVHFELLETSASAAVVAQRLGATMHGGGTRAIPQKTLYLLARLAEYGSDSVGYKLFPDEAATSYKRFLLRNSGNDWYGPDTGVATMIKDAVFHRLAKNLDISVMAYRPTVAYLNGEYWGLHNLRESFDKHYLATRYGLEADNVDLLMHEEDPIDNEKVKITRIDGDVNADEEYEAMIDWIQLNPLSDPANYQQMQQWIDVTNYTDYIVAETFFGNTDWPINNCDFWRAHTNQVAACGKYGDTRWRWMLYDLDVAGEEGAAFDMFVYLSDNDMTGGSEPGFLINQLWANLSYRSLFVTRYANALNTAFRPERAAGVISQAAAAIAPEIETHFRRWGRSHTQAQWALSVSNALVQYTAARHAASWGHLDGFFLLGGTGQLAVRNAEPSGAGGRFTVNGVVIETSTDGVTNRAAWSGTFFQSLGVPVVAVPDAGYAFDGWVGTSNTNAARTLFVGASPLTVVARFRPAASPPYAASGYEQWQLANYSEQEIVSGAGVGPNDPSGCAGMSNFELYAFGMHRNDGLTDAQRVARASLSLGEHSSARWVGYNRLNSSFTDVRYTLKVAASLTAPVAWSNAAAGADLGPRALTNTLDASTWFYEVELAPAAPPRDARFFKLEAAPQ